MKKNTKRFLSLALAMVLVLTNAPLQIFAEGDARPNATVTTLTPTTLEAGEYQVWNGSLTEGTEDLPLQIVMHFKANDTFEQAQASKYAKWKCDFYLTFEGLEGDSVLGDGSYLAGNYGDYGWIKIPTDGLEVEEGVEYPIVSNYDANLTYENVCDYVKEFTAALYVNPVILRANPNMKVTLKLKMTDPQNEDNVLVIGKPAVYKAEDLLKMPNATVTKLDPMTLDASEYTVWDGSSLKEGTEAIMLQAVMQFKANDTFEQAQDGGYGKWICDFYLTFEGLEGGSVSGNGSYLAGNYGSYGWIKIPTDGLEVEEGVEYPIVTNYDANLTYENVCDYVKEFTAALYIDPATLQANPNMKVTLKLKMTNPENPDDVMVIGEPAVYTAQQLLAAKAKPQAEVTILDPITLPAGEYSVYTGSLATGDTARPLQILMNFKAKDSLAQAQAGGYGKWKCDFYLTFNGMESGSVLGDGSYLAGKYEDGGYDYLGWIVIPTDGLEVEEGVEYPIVSNYDANLTYENICDYVKSFTAALYVNPDVLEANRNMTVTLTLKMTNPDDPTETMIIGEPAVFSSPVLQGYVAHNTDTDKYYEDVNDANNEAKTGETVILLTDVEVDKLFVSETFDLNGHTLTAKYVACYGSIVDGSDENTGLLKVDPDNILMRKANKQVPIRTEDGYRFVEILGFNMLYQAEKGRFVFQPLFEEYAHELVRAGAEVSGVAIQVNVTWKNAKGETRQQTFVYEDAAFLQGFFDSYNPETGKYSQMFTLVLATTAEVSYQIQVVSDGGTVHASGITAAAAPETTTTTEETTLNTNAEANQASALVPVGTKLSGNATSNSLKLTVENVQNSQSNIVLEDGEVRKSVDVHITGIAPDNTVPTIVTLLAFAEPGLNEGNFALYHVEYGKTKAMTKVAAPADVDTHNEFFYDPATGDVTMALATFSEIAMVSETAKAWEGNFDYSWYTNAVAPADGEAVTEYIIANADQLAAFGAIVGGMNGQTQDSFKDKTVKLVADINLGDKESENNPDIIFYPIGYYNSEGTYERTNTAITSGLRNFEGTFDGNGHTISNFYQNTWEMKGDHDWYSPEEQYYRDGMGLFGRVYGGTVKNLTVKNFSSDGEIATTGVIAAYADGATFENIAIMDCNPRVYNIGNGGIVGCVGWYAKEANLKTTFKNITVDNSNKISALWGSYDVACGGIVGQYYPTSGQTSAGTPKNGGIEFVNCHVSAQIDVYNDVCGNYQYYAYRYAGMMIGSIRENLPADENGHIYPDMTGITASGCTVHFGTWNDYYYCEFEKNGHPSYSGPDDYKFSRVPNSEIDTTNGKENATCIGHNHTDAEDNQAVYLPFDQLFTGYGWGVTSKGIKDVEDIRDENGNQILDITILDRTVADSKIKFDKADTAKDSYTTGMTVSIGELFKAADLGDDNLSILSNTVHVTVSPVGEESTAGGSFAADTSDWTKGTLTFSGTGAAVITITDYYFCKATTIIVTITERVAVEKFDVVMNNGDFLHRVGNVGTVALDKLFKAKDGVTVGTVSVTVEAVKGTASGTYSNNAIQFNGTGVVKVTITDNDYCTPTELILEVVDAVNATSATSATSNNVVLLKDCGFSSLEVSGGYTLYGNGFTMTCGSDSAALDMGYSFVTLNNGTLDNVQIVCPNFDYAVLYKSNMTESGNRSETTDKTRYFNVKSGVMVSGNSQILNSRISGGRAAVNVSGGNCLIENSRIELGAVASLLVGAANGLTLRDVTLVQKPTASTYDSSKTLMGFSVLFICDADGNAAPVTIEGTLVQNAWVDENDKQYVPSAGQSIISTVLGKTDYLHDLDGDGTKESLNLGFAYMPESLTSKVNTTTITDNRTNKDAVPYDYAEVSILSGKTYVYSYKNTNGTEDSFKTESEYVPNKYSDIITVSYSDTADGLTTGKSFGTDGWVYELNVDLDKLSGYTLDFSKLSMSVNGVAVTDFKVNGNAKPTSPVAVTAGGVTYTLTATVNGKECTATYKVTGTETSKESPSLVASNYEAGLCVASSYGGTWHGAAPALQGIQIKYWSVAEKQYKTITLSDYTPTTKGQLNGTNTTWTYSPANGDFTLTLTGGQVHSSNNVYAMPVVCDGKLYFVAAKSNGLVNSGNSARTIPVTYTFKDNNNGDVLTFSHTWSVAENKDAQYKYSDFCNGTLTKLKASGGSSSCVTPDTLVTLADGTQVRVDSLTGDEMLLVWNMETGKLDSAPILFVDSDPQAEYEIVHLYFSDGTDAKVIYEHGFWDYDLNKYVYLDANAADYIGHTFAKHSGDNLEKVVLTDVVIETEVTTAWSPVTEGHLCYFVNGMLSMPGGVGGLFNIFEVDPETMTYDFEAMQQDIEKYGLYTYEELNAIAPLSREMFEGAGGAYLKVSIGKGNLTEEELVYMINRYSEFFN